jgi:hypothetical protein
MTTNSSTSQRGLASGAKPAKSQSRSEAIEPHDLAGQLTHDQRVSLAKGLGDLYRRKLAEDAARKQ